MNSVTTSSVPMWIQALSLSGVVAASSTAASARPGRTNPSNRPPVPATLSFKNSLRSTDSAMLIVASLLQIGSAMNGASNRLVGAAAADVAAHGLIDVRVGGIRRLREQRGSGHDLAALAIAALRHIELHPRALHRMRPIRREPFDRRHALAGDIRDRDAARLHGAAIDVNRARAALGKAATEFRAGEADRVAQHPKQGHLAGNVGRLSLAVEGEFEGHLASQRSV